MRGLISSGGGGVQAFLGGNLPPPIGFPGQPGNLVGFANTPAAPPAKFGTVNGGAWPGAYPGSLTAWPGAGTIDGTQTGHATSGAGTSGNPWIFAFYDFVGTAGDVNGAGGGLWICNLSNSIFVGCRFAVNNVDNANMTVGSGATPTNVNFIYCSYVPLPSFATSPPGYTWPSAGTGLNTNTFSDNVNCIPHAKSYQYGITFPPSGSKYVVDHCDFWGFGNAITVIDGTNNVTISDCHIHDAAQNVDSRSTGTNTYHTDGPGYLNNTGVPNHITIDHCTIASIGTTNAIAFQAAPSSYDHMTVNNSLLSGFALCVDMCHDVTGSTNLTFTNNTITTDVQWFFGIGGTASTITLFRQASNLWRNNKFVFRPGTTSPTNGGFVTGDNGKYVWPDGSVSTSEFS